MINVLESSPASVGREHANLPPVSLQADVLKEFLGAVGRKKRAVLLDIGAPTGSNVEILFGLKMKLYLEDLLEAYSKPEYSTGFKDHWTINTRKFFSDNFRYPFDFFDGLICWDLLSYLDPEFAALFIARLSSMMKSKSLIFALFQTRRPSGPEGLYRYRIVSESNLERTLTDRAVKIRKIYQTRDVTQLFEGYETRRCLLMKNNILAVIMQKH